MPVFSTQGWVLYSVVFLILVAALCAAAWYIATREAVAKVLERFEAVLFPLVMVLFGIGILILA